MTAHDAHDDRPETDEADPIGAPLPPARSRVGSRAMALIGLVGMGAVGLAAATEVCSTWPTLEQ
ncbi:hypothetical protein [Kribbella sp. DT2]|uniref:hypothetical protein n=1 Tax=Kribbella sp. DT2 TaxID=3393427 RepID=UPI003CF87F97